MELCQRRKQTKANISYSKTLPEKEPVKKKSVLKKKKAVKNSLRRDKRKYMDQRIWSGSKRGDSKTLYQLHKVLLASLNGEQFKDAQGN